MQLKQWRLKCFNIIKERIPGDYEMMKSQKPDQRGSASPSFA